MLRKKILSISLAGFIIASVLLGCGSSTVVPEGTEKGLNEAGFRGGRNTGRIEKCGSRL